MMMMMIVMVWVESPPAGSPKLKTVPKLCKNCLHLMPDISGGMLLFGGIQRKCQHVDMIGNHMIWWDLLWYYNISYDLIWYEMISYDIKYSIEYHVIWYDVSPSWHHHQQTWEIFGKSALDSKNGPLFCAARNCIRLFLRHSSWLMALEILMFIWFWDMARS